MSAPAPALPARPALRPSFDRVAEEHLDAVVRYLSHLVADRGLAEDLTSDTFERALRAWASFDPRRGTPLVWLIGIARRIALDHFRSERRRRGRETRWASERDGTAAAPSGPSGLSPALSAALERLTRAERELIALRVVLELDVREAAALAGISPSACSTRLHRAMTKLRREVGPDEA